jgi:hypothetical protein
VWKFVVVILAACGLFLFLYFLGRLSGRRVASITILCAVLGAWVAWSSYLFAVFWWAPGPTAVGTERGRLLRVSSLRKCAVALTFLPVWVAFGRSLFKPGEAALASCMLLIFGGAVWVLTRDRIVVTREELVRDTKIGRRTVRWGDVTAVEVTPGGVAIHSGEGRLVVHARWMDGYPELAAALLERVPPQVLEASAGREILEAQAALATHRA